MGRKFVQFVTKKTDKQIDTVFLGKVRRCSQLQKYVVMDTGVGIVPFGVLSLSFIEKPYLTFTHIYKDTHPSRKLEFLLHSQVLLKFKMAKY